MLVFFIFEIYDKLILNNSRGSWRSMKRILLLEITGFPEKFLDVEVIPPVGTSKENYMEEKVLGAINTYNPKLKISNIEYINIQSQFPKAHISKSTGLIVEDIHIKDSDKEEYSKMGYYTYEDTKQYYARTIISYVFFTNPTESGRNILVAQSIFPAFMEYMNDFISSPSYTITNLPIYYVNIINKTITAQTIIKPLSALIATGVNYVEIFPTTIDASKVPRDLESFVKAYETGVTGTAYNSDYYQVDFESKRLKLKTTNLVIGDYLETDGTYIKFKGSSEKFYWMGVIPIFLLACQENYKIDYSELKDFYNSQLGNFRINNDKMERFAILLKFIEKLTT